VRGGCGLWDGSAVSRLEVMDEDRARFLNGLVTADIPSLEPGTSGYGLLTTLKGRVLADFTALVHTDRIWLRLPPGMGPTVREHMEKYVVTDRVVLRAVNDMVPLLLVGPQATERLAGWVDTPTHLPGPGEHRTVSVLGSEICLLGETRLGAPGFSLWVSASIAKVFVNGLLDASAPPRPVGLLAMESLRVEAGLPRFGLDFDHEVFPQEAGLDSAVSYEKGCYLGQEIVARIHYRGGVHRGLCRMSTNDEIVAGQTLLADSLEVGSVTSVAVDASGGAIALGLVANDSAVAGTVLTTPAGGRVEVLDLPDVTG
jgi:folate-binding protein YgfZ